MQPNLFAQLFAFAAALGCSEEEMQLAFDPPPTPHPMVEAVRNLLEQRKHWTGSATELLDLLQPFAPCHTPIACKTPKGVSQQIKNRTRVWPAMLTLADTPLHGATDLPEESGGADCKNDPQSAPPDFEPSPEPTQTAEVKTP